MSEVEILVVGFLNRGVCYIEVLLCSVLKYNLSGVFFTYYFKYVII